ncbi:MAG TPA: dienelactone hydrolase family protein [Chitinophagaceae bacterium]|nr:dienelactone hydrolase family protein [Chitinophagaceae bacterium]
MKKLFSFALLFTVSLTLLAQKNKKNQPDNCCAISATTQFAHFASDVNFKMSHDEPLPYHFVSEMGGTDITFKAADGSDAYGYEIKASKKTNFYIFVIHEWWGLNDYIKKEAEKLNKDFDVNVIALDLYDKKVAFKQEDAAKYMQSASAQRIQNIIKGAIAYTGNEAKIFTIGWCFGGGWSLQTSILAGKQAAGCIMYYGMPEKNKEKLKSLKADVLGIFANKEQWITPQLVNDFEASLKKLNKKATFYRYNAVHAFANPSNPNYDKAATEDAYKHVTEFLKARIK